jgi:hypothetical protein
VLQRGVLALGRAWRDAYQLVLPGTDEYDALHGLTAVFDPEAVDDLARGAGFHLMGQAQCLEDQGHQLGACSRDDEVGP